MALLRPRQFGTNSPDSHSLPSQNSQPGTPPSMTIALGGLTGSPTGDPFPTPTSTSLSTSDAPSKTTSSPQTTLKSTTSGRAESSSTQSQTSGSFTTSNPIPLSTNTPSVVTSTGGSSGYGSSTAVGEAGASALSSSSFSPSATPASIFTGTEVKCTSLSCSPGKAAAIFVPIAIVSALLLLCIVFFCARRKGRARLGQGLAFFSHGAETNYVSAPASSAGNSRAPSMREAGSSSGPLAAGAALGPAGAAGLAAARGNHDPDFGLGFVPEIVSRSSSCAAPPPYAPRQSNDLNHDAVEPANMTSRSPVAAPVPAHTHTASDPFVDTLNPFADENASLLSGDTAINREIGSRRSVRDNASIVSSLRDMDEAGSIREAQVADLSRGPSLAGGRSRPGGSS